jgi:hypothetical protein
LNQTHKGINSIVFFPFAYKTVVFVKTLTRKFVFYVNVEIFLICKI